MSGYSNRIVRKDYPQLGEKVFVEFRNPATASADMLWPDANSNLTQRESGYLTISRLLRNWCLYDATSDDEEPPELEGPATPEMVAKMPFIIVRDLTEAISQAVAGPR
jgi:hypothetical protein